MGWEGVRQTEGIQTTVITLRHKTRFKVLLLQIQMLYKHTKNVKEMDSTGQIKEPFQEKTISGDFKSQSKRLHFQNKKVAAKEETLRNALTVSYLNT